MGRHPVNEERRFESIRPIGLFHSKITRNVVAVASSNTCDGCIAKKKKRNREIQLLFKCDIIC